MWCDENTVRVLSFRVGWRTTPHPLEGVRGKELCLRNGYELSLTYRLQKFMISPSPESPNPNPRTDPD